MSETLTVVVPTWRRPHYLRACLESLVPEAPTLASVIVVVRPDDSESLHVVRETATRYPDLALKSVEVDRPGHVAPVLRGLESVATTVVAFLDDDVEVEAGWSLAILSGFSDQSVVCVGGRMIVPGYDAVVRDDAGRLRWYGRQVGNGWVPMLKAPRHVVSVPECNWAWRTLELQSMNFDSVLDFDDAHAYGLDLCLQALVRGKSVLYVPKATVVHHVAPRDASLDRAAIAERAFAYSRNYSYIMLRRLSRLQLVPFVLWWFLIGERASYGLLKGLADLMLRRTSPQMMGAAMRGKIVGGNLAIRSALHAPRETPPQRLRWRSLELDRRRSV
jgi:GT2 family glycosyltransferase